MKLETKINIYAQNETGRINPHIYGHFIENMARCIYGGLLKNLRPGDPRGPWVEREVVVEWIRELCPPVIRWPGGLYADGYHWRDGIGPPGERPVKRNRYWSRFGPFTRVLDSNWFGSEEFMDLLERVGAEAYINVNLGTGTEEEAARWVEFMVGETDTIEGALRSDGGHPETYEVSYWGIGNETYGPWALGHTTPERYGRRYLEFREAIREVDPGASCVAVGADHYNYRDWNNRLLMVIGEGLELLSFHVYLPGLEKGFPYLIRSIRDREGIYYAIVGAGLEIEDRIRWVAESIDGVLGRNNGVGLALDEWNLWWKPSQLLTPRYCLRDALFICGVFHAMHRTCDRLVLANLAQLVNVLGLIRASGERCHRTSIYYPFVMYSQLTGTRAVETKCECGTFSAPKCGGISAREEIPFIDCSSTISDDGKTLTVFAINRHIRQGIKVEIGLTGFQPKGGIEVYCLNGPDAHAFNDFGDDEIVNVSVRTEEVGRLLESCELPPHSATALVFRST